MERHFLGFRNEIFGTWGPLSLVSTVVELLGRKTAAPVQKTENTAVEIRCAYHATPSIRKSWH
jgi:hypothetical protein